MKPEPKTKVKLNLPRNKASACATVILGPIPQGFQVPKYEVDTVSIVGLVITVLGICSASGYLDRQGLGKLRHRWLAKTQKSS